MNYQTLSNKGNKKGLLPCLLIPLLCVLRYYEAPLGLLSNRLSIAVMIVMVVMIPLIYKGKAFEVNISVTRHFVSLCAVIAACYFLSLILYDFVADSLSHTINKLLYILLVAILCLYCTLGYINHYLLTKIYIGLAVLFALLGIVQWGLGLAGIGVDMKLPLLEYYNGGEKYTLFSQKEDSFTHVPSVFAEASHFAAFLLPAIVFLLAKYKIEHRIIKLAILVIGVMVSTSANGIICLAIIIFSFTYFSQKKLKPNRVIIGMVLIIIVIAALFSGAVTDVLDGVFSSTTSDDTKADYRIYRGFELYSELPFHQKLLGIGSANIQVFYAEGLMDSEYDRAWRAIDFLSAFASIIIYNGFVGLLAFALFMKALWKKTNWATKTIILTFVAYSISEDFYFNEYWLLYISLICSSRYVFENKKENGMKTV